MPDLKTQNVAQRPYLEAERTLATQLGWTELLECGDALLGRPPEGLRECRGQAMVPRWCRDWSVCGPLITQYDIDLQHDAKDTIFTNWAGSSQGLAHDVINHPDKDTALRFSVVRAVIAKLEQELHPRAGRQGPSMR